MSHFPPTRRVGKVGQAGRDDRSEPCEQSRTLFAWRRQGLDPISGVQTFAAIARRCRTTHDRKRAGIAHARELDPAREVSMTWARTTDNRIRGRRLLGFRRRLLFQQQPLCVECQKQGRIRLATERDHIIALCNGGTDTSSNTQALCSICHEQKTAGTRQATPSASRLRWLEGRRNAQA